MELDHYLVDKSSRFIQKILLEEQTEKKSENWCIV